MTQTSQPPRGTQDFLGRDARLFQHIATTARTVMARYGYGEIMTPIFEHTEVFTRPLGESSDAVSKEMYTFQDRGGDHLSLRPEGTAGVVRAFISNGLTQDLPQRFFYIGPMFRYERPQKGRFRQHHQVGCEVLGSKSPETDVEGLMLAQQYLSQVGLGDKIELRINTLGDAESYALYRQALLTYFRQHKHELSADSQTRLELNPLRILDSKDPQDQAIKKSAPVIDDFLTPAAKQFWQRVQSGLRAAGIPFVRDTNIVRGLDYYRHTTFEFVTTHLGAQGTVLAGGRYDGFVSTLGGPDIAGFGWGSGVERLMLLRDDLTIAAPPLVMLLPIDDTARDEVLQMAQQLRQLPITTEIAWDGDMKKMLKYANKRGAIITILRGSSERDNQAVMVKDMTQGTQQLVAATGLVEHVAHQLNLLPR